MSKTRRKYLLWAAAGLVLAVGTVLLIRRRNAQAQNGTLDTSGRPGPDLSGSQAAVQPPGGAQGDTAPFLVDPLSAQVQAADAGSDDTPTMQQGTSPSAQVQRLLDAGVTPTSINSANGSTITQQLASGSLTYAQIAPALQPRPATSPTPTPTPTPTAPAGGNRLTRGD